MVTKTAEGGYEAHIQGHLFTFTKWGTTQSLMSLLELMQMCADGVGHGAGIAFTQEIEVEQVTADLVSKFVASLLTGLAKDPNKTLNVIKRLCTDRVLIDGRKVAFETDFNENLTLLIECVIAAVEVQFANFSFMSPMMTQAQGIMAASQPKPSSPASPA